VFVYLIVVFLGFLLLAYFIRIFRKHFFSLAEDSLALVDTLLLKIDEDEKVKLVTQKNTKLILSLGKVLGSIFLAIVIGSIPFVIYLLITGENADSLDFSSAGSIISLTLGSTLGFIIPLKKKKEQSYSELAQLLHRMALNNYAVALKLFRIEAKKLAKKGIKPKEQFVIVSGLARAGTTSLMNKLNESERFATLSYANMPFVTAPHIWSKFYKPKSDQKKERSHKDGIMIGLDSNEALEEYFFKALSNDSYITEDAVRKYELTEDEYGDYIKYQAVIRNDADKIYLAKNNNFALRYESMRAHNPDFTIIFMYRDPLSHAASLLEKHKEFSAMQEDDPFVLEYMDWLGHHEFGNNQKPFQFGEDGKTYPSDKYTLDYWLAVWINYYSYLLTLDRSKILLVDYEFYCEQPRELLEKIYDKLGIDTKLPELTPFVNKRKAELECSEDLKTEAYRIFEKLKAN